MYKKRKYLNNYFKNTFKFGKDTMYNLQYSTVRQSSKPGS